MMNSRRDLTKSGVAIVDMGDYPEVHVQVHVQIPERIGEIATTSEKSLLMRKHLQFLDPPHHGFVPKGDIQMINHTEHIRGSSRVSHEKYDLLDWFIQGLMLANWGLCRSIVGKPIKTNYIV